MSQVKSAYTFEELVQIRKEQRATIKRLEQENTELKLQLAKALSEVEHIYSAIATFDSKARLG